MPYLLLLVVVIFSSFARADGLNVLITKALNSHPDLMVQEARLQIANTQLDLAKEQFYPTFSVSVENVAKTRDVDRNYGTDQAVATFRLQQTLYAFGRLRASEAKFAAGVNSQTLALEEIKLDLAQSVLQAWGEWFVADLRLEAIIKNKKTHQELKDSVSRRAEKGASSPSEVRLSVARLAQVEAQLANAMLQAEAAKVKLEQLVGEPLPSGAEPRQFLEYVLDESPVMVMQALSINPTLMRYASDIAQSEAEVEEEIAALGPEIYLRAEHQRGDYATDIPFQNRVFIGFQSDFGAGSSALMEVKLAEQRITTLKAEVEAAKRDIVERVQLELTQLRLLDVRQKALELSLSANEDIAKAFNRQYLAGRRSWVEVMNTARELSQAELELAELKAAKVLSYWRLSFLVNGVTGTLAASQPISMN